MTIPTLLTLCACARRVRACVRVCSVLLFDKGRVLKLCDFGTAKMLEHTLTNAVGTIRYMAPEVIRGQFIKGMTVIVCFGC